VAAHEDRWGDARTSPFPSKGMVMGLSLSEQSIFRPFSGHLIDELSILETSILEPSGLRQD
jgi:hypothetical protein